MFKAGGQCDQDHLTKLSFPLPAASPYAIWVQWRRCLKTTDVGLSSHPLVGRCVKFLRKNVKNLTRRLSKNARYQNSMTSSRENLILLFTNNTIADQPAHPRSLVSAFVIQLLNTQVILCV